MKALRTAVILVAAVIALGGCRKRGASEFDAVRAEDLVAQGQRQDEAAGIPVPPAPVDVKEDSLADTRIGELTRRGGADRIAVRNVGRLWETFNDSNHRQYQYAEALGILPVNDLRGAYHTRRPIIKIESNSYYEVAELTHSLPYLVPEGARLLEDIGRSFIDSLRSRGADGYSIVATSLLRTPHTVKRLRRVNVNATDSSTHQFGTTFDLSYHRFRAINPKRSVNEEDLKNLLAEVLLDFRNRGRCLVKYERKTGCFHITATR